MLYLEVIKKRECDFIKNIKDVNIYFIIKKYVNVI